LIPFFWNLSDEDLTITTTTYGKAFTFVVHLTPLPTHHSACLDLDTR
jgi:hypothetical protein